MEEIYFLLLFTYIDIFNTVVSIMDISQLRAFCVLVETGNLREASKTIHLSPGALSKGIQKLESELNVKLFARVKQRLILNDHGRSAYQIAKRILQEAELLKEIAMGRNLDSSIFRIGSYSTFTTYFMGPLLKERLGDEKIVVQPFLPGEIEKALLDRIVDIGITTFPISHESLRLDSVIEFEMGIFARRGNLDNVPFEELPFAIPFVKFDETSIGGKALDGWPEFPVRRVKYYMDSLETLLETCRQGLAAAVFPKFVVRLHNDEVLMKYRLRMHDLPQKMDKIKFKAFLVTRNADALSPFYRDIRESMKRICSLT